MGSARWAALQESGEGRTRSVSAGNAWVTGSVMSGLVAALQTGAVEYYQASDPVRGLLDTIKREQGLPTDANFMLQSPDPRTRSVLGCSQGRGLLPLPLRNLGPCTCRAKPLFNCTASQLGMNQTRGIPSLLDATLPHGTPMLQRSYLRHLLHSPPPSEVAASIREACSILAGTDSLWSQLCANDRASSCGGFRAKPLRAMVVPAALRIALPNWVVLDMGVVARLLNAREAPVNFFRDLRAVVCGVQNALEHPQLHLLAKSILAAVVLEAGMHFDLDTLLQACR